MNLLTKKHWYKHLFLLLLIAFSPLQTAYAENPFESLGDFGGGMGGGADEILEPDQAFMLSTKARNGKITASWEIADGHYMYRNKVKITPVNAANVSTGQLQLDKGELKHDEYFGDIYVFHHQANATLPISEIKDGAKSASFKVKYQGCSEISGICYPPITKTVTLDISPISSASAATSIDIEESNEPITEQDKILNQLLNASLMEAFFLSLGFGVLIAFTACMYPMIPILSSIIVGQGEDITVGKAFGMSLIYVEGMALTFGVIGAIIATLGESIGIQAYFQSPALLIPFAILFVILAFAMFGFYNIQIPTALQSKISNISNQQKSGNIIGVASMGVLSALIIGPCGGPVLFAELAYAAAASNPTSGFMALFAFGNGMGLPLLVVGATGGKLLPKAGTWMDAVKAGAGVILLAIAIILLERMPSIFSPTLTMAIWSSLLIISGVYLGALEPLQKESSGWYRFWKGIGVVFIIYGILVIIGGMTGGSNVLDPMHGSSLTVKNSSSSHTNNKLSFKRIKTVDDLNESITFAKQQKKSVMLDFYADWCGYCKTLEAYVFPDPEVQKALRNTILIQADVTKMDKEDERLLKTLGIPLPPGLVFFDTHGKELKNYRVIGEIDAKKLSLHINKAFNKI
jgi:thioredoxin:protein disulfide reductase